MAPSNHNLARSLAVLRDLQQSGNHVFRTAEFTRTHRERLLYHGFLQPVIKGWVRSSDPTARPGDSTAWYGYFWEFCAHYCEARFGTEWVFSPQQSLLIHAENTVVPRQVLVFAKKGSNNTLSLPFETSLLDVKAASLPSDGVVTRGGLRIYTTAMALIKAPERFFVSHSTDAQVVLGQVRDASSLLRILLEGGHSVVAGRLAGAMRRVGRNDVAHEILDVMRQAGFAVRETDPFSPEAPLLMLSRQAAPIVTRIRGHWQAYRETVTRIMPRSRGLPVDTAGYLRSVDEAYVSDAYHSLSIEGYQVSDKLIEHVRTGAWDPNQDRNDRKDRDALAARGYWQAFKSVKGTLEDVLAGQNPGLAAERDHRRWYRELWQPCVAAGITEAARLAGYRNDAVYLRGSRYTPPRWEAVRDAMPELFTLIASEPEPAVRAVLGHWLFGYIHPYPDGNGRVARFLMNVMLASGGYPWTVISVEDRYEYMQALDAASVDNNIEPFALLIAKTMS